MDKRIVFHTDQEMFERLIEVSAWVREMAPDTVCAASLPEIVSCNAAENSAVWRYRTKARMSNPAGVAHGSIAAGVLDNAMGVLVRAYQADGFVSTVNLNVNYVRAMPLDAEMIVTSRIVRLGNKVSFAEASISTAARPDAVCATASGAFCSSPGHKP